MRDVHVNSWKNNGESVLETRLEVYEVLGIEKLNKHQKDSIKYVVENEKDIFVNLPTGFSKLLIYQVLPIVFSSVQFTCEKYIVTWSWFLYRQAR